VPLQWLQHASHTKEAKQNLENGAGLAFDTDTICPHVVEFPCILMQKETLFYLGWDLAPP